MRLEETKRNESQQAGRKIANNCRTMPRTNESGSHQKNSGKLVFAVRFQKHRGEREDV